MNQTKHNDECAPQQLIEDVKNLRQDVNELLCELLTENGVHPRIIARCSWELQRKIQKNMPKIIHADDGSEKSS